MTSAELWFPFQCVIMQCSTARLSGSREKQCCNEALIQYCSAVQLVPTQKVRLCCGMIEAVLQWSTDPVL